MGTIELRPIEVGELATICALHNRSEAHDGIPRILELEELAEELDDDHVVLATDTRVAVVDGSVAGYAYTYHLPSDSALERCWVFGEVDPGFRRRGVGRTLLAWGIARATEQLRSSHNDLPKYVRVDSYDYVEDTHRLYARMGFEPVRWFEELLRPLTDLPDVAVPAGVRIEPWPDDRDEEIRLVKNAAFADHWGSTPMTPDLWHHHVHGFGARPDLSFVAVDGATRAVVAFCLNYRFGSDDELLGRRDGWIDNLGTLAPWRGKWLASALIAASLHRFAEEGLTHASIGVDADSLTGASRLYRSLGFELRQRSITSQIEVG